MKQRRFASVVIRKSTNVKKRVEGLLQGDEVYFTILFSAGVTLLLAGLAVREGANGGFRNVISTVVPDDDGEITISLGRFALGSTVEVSFTAFVVNKAANAVALLTYRDVAGQIAPAKGTASLKVGVVWEGKGRILVSAPGVTDE